MKITRTGVIGATLATCLATGSQASGPNGPSSSSPVISSESTLGRTDLLQATLQPRAFRPKDKFAPSPEIPWAGRRFVVRQPLQQWTGKNCNGVATWNYDADGATLSFNTSGRLFGGGLGLTTYRGQPISGVSSYGHSALVLTCSEQSQGSYVAENGFGARTTIRRKSEVITLIASDKSGFDYAFRMDSVKLLPASARAVTPHLQLEIEGILSDWQEGNTLICGINHAAPTFGSVYDTKTDVCAYKATIIRVSVVDARNNSIVTEVLLASR